MRLNALNNNQLKKALLAVIIIHEFRAKRFIAPSTHRFLDKSEFGNFAREIISSRPIDSLATPLIGQSSINW